MTTETLSYCHHCGAELAPGDKFCFQCGTQRVVPAAPEVRVRNPRSHMLVILVIVGAFMLYAFVKCTPGTVRVGPTKTGPSTVRTAPQARPTLAAGRSAKIGPFRATLDRAEIVRHRAKSFTGLSGTYLLLHYSVTNTASSPAKADSWNWRAHEPDGGWAMPNGLGPEEVEFSKELRPGETARGMIPILLAEENAKYAHGVYTLDWDPDLFMCIRPDEFCGATWRIPV